MNVPWRKTRIALFLIVLSLFGYSVIRLFRPPLAFAIESCNVPGPLTPTPEEPHPLRPYPGGACKEDVDLEGRVTCGTEFVAQKTEEFEPDAGECLVHEAVDPINQPGRMKHSECTRDITVNTGVSLGIPDLELPIVGVGSNTAVSDTLPPLSRMRNYLDWYLQGATEQATQEPFNEDEMGVVTASASCRKVGANSAAFFNQVGEAQGFYVRAAASGMGWTLEIADGSDAQSTIDGINAAFARGLTPIVRIGIKESPGVPDPSFGFTNPQDYITFLDDVASQVTGTLYAIAGPNEPDGEHWVPKPDGTFCTDAEITCIGETTTSYMNAVIAAKQNGEIPDRVKLLSPVFNVTSHTFNPIIDSMVDNGAKFDDLDGIASNAYNMDSGSISDWIAKLTDGALPAAFQTLPIVLTETGKISGTLEDLKAELDALKSDPQVIGALLFNVFGTNDDFESFRIAETDLPRALGADCTSAMTASFLDLAGPLKKLVPSEVLDARREQLIDYAMGGETYNQIIGYVKDNKIIGRKQALALLEEDPLRSDISKKRLTDMNDHRKPTYVEGGTDSDNMWYALWRQVPFVQTQDLYGEIFLTLSKSGTSDARSLYASDPDKSWRFSYAPTTTLGDLKIAFPHLLELDQLAELFQSLFIPKDVPKITGFRQKIVLDLTNDGIDNPVEVDLTDYYASLNRETPYTPDDYCNVDVAYWNPGDHLETPNAGSALSGNFRFTRRVTYEFTDPPILPPPPPSATPMPEPTVRPVKRDVTGPLSVFIRVPLALDNIYDRLVNGPGSLYRVFFPIIEDPIVPYPAAAGLSMNDCGGDDCETLPGNVSGRKPEAFFWGLGTVLQKHQDLLCMLDPLGRCGGGGLLGGVGSGVGAGSAGVCADSGLRVTEKPDPSKTKEQIIATIGAQECVDASILTAILTIEAGPDYNPHTANFCNVNSCSAAGPMQITTGWEHVNCDPSKCGGSTCGSYCGDESNAPLFKQLFPGNPCNFEDALTIGTKLLKAKSQGKVSIPNCLRAVDADKEGLIRAAMGYYGNRYRNDLTPTENCTKDEDKRTRADLPGWDTPKTYCEYVFYQLDMFP